MKTSKKNIKSSKTPYHLVCDDDAHWYLLPESKGMHFEQRCEMAISDPLKYGYLMEEYYAYRVDDICGLRIFKWEET